MSDHPKVKNGMGISSGEYNEARGKMKQEQGQRASRYATIGAVLRFASKDMQDAFEAGAAFEREHQFMPPEIRPAKAAEEALARWPG